MLAKHSQIWWLIKFFEEGPPCRHVIAALINLAENAGTSVAQIERFYANHLPLSKEMAKNLQSFGEP